MIISVNGETIDSSQVEGMNLEEILFLIQKNHIPADHVVGDVQLNGRPYSEDAPHASVEVRREEIETLEVVTRSPEEIAHHFLANSPLLVDSLTESLPRIVEMFRLGDETEANEHYFRFLESLHLLVTMLDHVGRFIGLSYSQVHPETGSLNERLSKLARILTQLLEIQEQTDWVFLSDILEYELQPELESLRTIIPQLQVVGH